MENKSLYEITTELEAFNDLLEESGGEITEENEALMLRVNDLLTTKLDSCVSYMERENDLLDFLQLNLIHALVTWNVKRTCLIYLVRK